MLSMAVVPAPSFEILRRLRKSIQKRVTSLRRHLEQCTLGKFTDGACAVRSARGRASYK